MGHGGTLLRDRAINLGPAWVTQQVQDQLRNHTDLTGFSPSCCTSSLAVSWSIETKTLSLLAEEAPPPCPANHLHHEMRLPCLLLCVRELESKLKASAHHKQH